MQLLNETHSFIHKFIILWTCIPMPRHAAIHTCYLIRLAISKLVHDLLAFLLFEPPTGTFTAVITRALNLPSLLEQYFRPSTCDWPAQFTLVFTSACNQVLNAWIGWVQPYTGSKQNKRNVGRCEDMIEKDPLAAYEELITHVCVNSFKVGGYFCPTGISTASVYTHWGSILVYHLKLNTGFRQNFSCDSHDPFFGCSLKNNRKKKDFM